MFEGVIFGVITAFVLLGIVSISYYAMLRVLHPKSAGRYIILILADKDTEDVASQMYAEKLRISLLGDKGSVVLLDCGMKEHERVLCENMCSESEDLYISTPDTLGELISGKGL